MPGFLSAIGRLALTPQSDGAFRLMQRLCRRIVRHLGRRAAIANLRDADEAVLRDIGITRSQIEAAVGGEIRTLDNKEPAMTIASPHCNRHVGASGCAVLAETLAWN